MQSALNWIHAETGKRVTATRELKGGLTSDVRAVTLEGGEPLVLRRYPNGGKDAARQIEIEAATLKRIAAAGIPAPRLVAANASCDSPTLLMTRIPGRVWLTPRDTDAWLAQMARTLLTIHSVPISAIAPNPRSLVPKDFHNPDWTTRPELWKSANAVLASPPARYLPMFTHSDYQHFNMIWSGRRLSGIVDWCYAGPSHPDSDAAHCRLNLVILFSVDVAERFREMYEAEKGAPLEPWWDLRGLREYDDGWQQFIPVQVAGRAKVDTAGMDARVEDLIERILRRT